VGEESWAVEWLAFVGELVSILITTLKKRLLGLGNNPIPPVGAVEIDPLGAPCTFSPTHPLRHEFAKQKISTTSSHSNYQRHQSFRSN
jgi:hypothetical protein